MKNTLLKDTFREIKKTRSRFIAILLIVALGTAFFVGIKTTCPDMKLTANKYYKDAHFMDFRFASTMGFNDEDISAIKAQKGITGVMPSYSVDAVATLNGKEKVLRVVSLSLGNSSSNNSDYINRPEILKGRLPEKSGECVIESNKLNNIAPSIGQKIKLSSGEEVDLKDKLVDDEYTVVGIVRSPLYISKDRGTTTLGNGQVSAFIQILSKDFKLPYYNGMYVTVEMDDSIKAYSKEYDDKIASIKKPLESFANERAEMHYDEVKSEANKSLEDKIKAFTESAATVNSELLEAQNKINEGQNGIDNGKNKLAQNKIQSEKTFSNAKEQINAAKVTLANAEADYESKLTAFNLQKKQAIALGVYEAQKSVFDAKEAQLNAVKAQLDSNASDLAIKEQTLNKSQEDALKLIESNEDELKKQQVELNKAKSDYLDRKSSTEQKLKDAKSQIEDAQAKINDIPPVKWYVLDRNSILSYVDYGSAADRMNAIAQVFPVIFILVAILICFTSMSRMVEEQRLYMGTLKALGYSKLSILSKFIIYAVLASVFGGIFGLAVGFTVFPTIINRAYSILYTLPKLNLIFDVSFAIISLVTGILVTTLSALFVCLQELNLNTAALMRPRAPKAGKVIFLERITFIWKRLKFTQKVTARNLLRYKSRFFMTILGVGGCTALLLVGFGLNDAIKTIGDKQFGEIYKQQLTVNLKDTISSEETLNIKNTLLEQSDFSSMDNFLFKSIDIGHEGTEKTCNLVVPSNKDTLKNFIALRVRTTGAKVNLTDSGVILTEKLAKKLKINIGDEIYIKNGDTLKLKVKVTGICENYLQHYVYMSPSLYQKLYLKEPIFNETYVKLKNTDAKTQEAVSRSIASLKGVSSVNLISDNQQKFKDTIKSIYNIVIVLIVSAGLLSFIVLYTLTNININERMREIATIKVLGFYHKEVSSYVFRENFILTMLGALFGLIAGKFLASYVIGTAEVDMVMFGRRIYPLSFVLSALLTLLFAWIVNIAMLKRLKNIDMVEALKTVE